MPMCSCSNALDCSCASIIIHLHFIATLSIIVCSFSNMQYGCMSLFTPALPDGQPFTTCVLRSFRCVTFSIASWISCIFMHVGIFANASIALIFSFMPAISLSLSSAHFCLDSQFAMYNPGHVLSIMHILY